MQSHWTHHVVEASFHSAVLLNVEQSTTTGHSCCHWLHPLALLSCRMAHEIKGVRGRSMQAVAAAVLFCGCRQERQARTFKVGHAVASRLQLGRPCFKLFLMLTCPSEQHTVL